MPPPDLLPAAPSPRPPEPRRKPAPEPTPYQTPGEAWREIGERLARCRGSVSRVGGGDRRLTQ